jgi:hypothetical protein
VNVYRIHIRRPWGARSIAYRATRAGAERLRRKVIASGMGCFVDFDGRINPDPIDVAGELGMLTYPPSVAMALVAA